MHENEGARCKFLEAVGDSRFWGYILNFAYDPEISLNI